MEEKQGSLFSEVRLRQETQRKTLVVRGETPKLTAGFVAWLSPLILWKKKTSKQKWEGFKRHLHLFLRVISVSSINSDTLNALCEYYILLLILMILLEVRSLLLLLQGRVLGPHLFFLLSKPLCLKWSPRFAELSERWSRCWLKTSSESKSFMNGGEVGLGINASSVAEPSSQVLILHEGPQQHQHITAHPGVFRSFPFRGWSPYKKH